MLLLCCDVWLKMVVSGGVFPGDNVACLWFIACYHDAIDQIDQELRDSVAVWCRWLARAITNEPEERPQLFRCARRPVVISTTNYRCLADTRAKQADVVD